jgi:pheromone shutdown protein TraB
MARRAKTARPCAEMRAAARGAEALGAAVLLVDRPWSTTMARAEARLTPVERLRLLLAIVLDTAALRWRWWPGRKRRTTTSEEEEEEEEEEATTVRASVNGT